MARFLEHKTFMLVAITVFHPLVLTNHSEYILFKKHGKGFNISRAKS